MNGRGVACIKMSHDSEGMNVINVALDTCCEASVVMNSDLDPLHTYYKKQDVMRWKSFETQDLIEANCDTTAMSAMFLNYTPGFSSLFNYTGHWYPIVTAEIFLRAKRATPCFLVDNRGNGSPDEPIAGVCHYSGAHDSGAARNYRDRRISRIRSPSTPGPPRARLARSPSIWRDFDSN